MREKRSRRNLVSHGFDVGKGNVLLQMEFTGRHKPSWASLSVIDKDPLLGTLSTSQKLSPWKNNYDNCIG
jgi:hypothetical protein